MFDVSVCCGAVAAAFYTSDDLPAHTPGNPLKPCGEWQKSQVRRRLT
jgi:hypothetical protein